MATKNWLRSPTVLRKRRFTPKTARPVGSSGRYAFRTDELLVTQCIIVTRTGPDGEDMEEDERPSLVGADELDDFYASIDDLGYKKADFELVQKPDRTPSDSAP